MRRSLERCVVVITGATSGIGRATALQFAEAGARVVLAARNEAALAELEDYIIATGGEAIAVRTDVARWTDVQRLATTASERFGTIDVWINNAAVGVWSTIDEMTIDEINRVIHVDLLGTIYGVKAALPVMWQKRSGTIINVASALADRAIPLLSTYCAAKHGIKGFTESLRLELAREENHHIRSVLVLPAAVNTPFYSEGKSRLGVRPHPLKPVYEPELVARAIVDAARRPRRFVYVGGIGKMLSLAQRISPAAVDLYMLQNDRMAKKQLTTKPDRDESNLFAPTRAPRVRGDYKARKFSLYTSLMQHNRGAVALTLLGLAAVRAALRRR